MYIFFSCGLHWISLIETVFLASPFVLSWTKLVHAQFGFEASAIFGLQRPIFCGAHSNRTFSEKCIGSAGLPDFCGWTYQNGKKIYQMATKYTNGNKVDQMAVK
jgi:hypothetical protein